MSRKVTSKSIIRILFVAICGSALSGRADAFELSSTLHLGAHVGYSGTYADTSKYPNIFNGAAFGLQGMYGFNESVALLLEGTFDWHAKYTSYVKDEVTNEDKEVSMEWVAKSAVEHYYLTTWALSIVYAVDVTRVVPYLLAGTVGMRMDRTVDGVHDAAFGFGLRLGGGFDYCFERLTIGAGITSDRYYVGNSDQERRILFFLRVSSLFHFSR